MPKVSVIIPCYNMGEYLDEAVGSVLDQSFEDYEIIIVDDGSTDPETLNILSNYNQPKTQVIRTINQGPSAARNAGIAQSQGEYVLPLDADDKIGKNYLAKASTVLDENPEIEIVYCRARLFGARDREWILPPYSIEAMLIENVIFASAMFRKTTWENAGGYNVNMVHGYEDYDYWLSVLEKEDVGVYKIDEVLFYYRIRANSRGTMLGINNDKEVEMLTQLFYNHTDFYLRNGRIRICIAKRLEILKELQRMQNIIQESPMLRLEIGMDEYPKLKDLYMSTCRKAFRFFMFLKSIFKNNVETT